MSRVSNAHEDLQRHGFRHKRVYFTHPLLETINWLSCCCNSTVHLLRLRRVRRPGIRPRLLRHRKSSCMRVLRGALFLFLICKLVDSAVHWKTRQSVLINIFCFWNLCICFTLTLDKRGLVALMCHAGLPSKSILSYRLVHTILHQLIMENQANPDKQIIMCVSGFWLVLIN
jgi:hypothetical protein